MALKRSLLCLAAAATLASAHFAVEYPAWRADSLAESNTTTYSQYDYPCAGVPYADDVTRTPWPLTGGSVKLDLHHDWTYLFINLGLSANVSNYNISLTPEFLNVTGSGTYCISKLNIPSDVQINDGDLASLQFVTLGAKGSALYNCAEIRFASDATELPAEECTTDEGISATPIAQQDGSEDDTGSNGSNEGDNNSDGGDTPTGAATGLSLSHASLGAVVGMVLCLIAGM